MNDFAKEVEEFLKSESTPEPVTTGTDAASNVDSQTTDTKVEVVDDKVADTKVEETPTTEDEPKKEVVEPTKVVKKAEVEATPAKVEPEVKVSTEDGLRATVDKLMGEIAELKKVPVLTKVEPDPKVETKVEDLVKAYLGDTHIDDVVTKPELFVKVLKAVEERAREEAVTRVITQMPNMMIRYIQQHTALQTATKEFYEVNDDLVGARKTVGAFANEVSSEHPDWTLAQVLEETAARTRKAMGLAPKAASVGVVTKTKSSPALVKTAGKSGRSNAGPALSGLQKEIGELIT